MKNHQNGNQKGIAVVELLLIVVVLITLVFLFKGEITNIVSDILDTISSEAGKI
ncbi:MAG: Flp1 family type IVb pilin [Lachnospiraceae bacterium]